MLSQKRPVVPPDASDTTLRDYSEIIQGSFRQLFEAGHNHPIKTAAPALSDGTIGDIYIVQVSGTWYLYAKVALNTWKKVALS